MKDDNNKSVQFNPEDELESMSQRPVDSGAPACHATPERAEKFG